MPVQPLPDGRAICRRSSSTAPRIVASLLLILALVGTSLSFAPVTTAEYLGDGKYSMTASVFGTESDDLIGEMTASGRFVAEFDRIVALPACTASSCPWLSLDADPTGDWGPQTDCAEANGYCWVEITSSETGLCAVAPVVDLGPLFVRDNWWETKPNRVYSIARGVPAAEVARDGADLGFGPGISDAGYDIQNVYRYAAGIDLGAGTFVDLGLDPDEGITSVSVRLLWQAPGDHTTACNGSAGNGVAAEDVNLRTGPSTNDDVLQVIQPGSRLSISGPLKDGFYQVDVDGQRGWAFADYIRPDGGNVGNAVGLVIDEVNLRGGPSTADEVLTVIPEGSMAVVLGDQENGFVPVRYLGIDGWVASDYLNTGDTPTDGGGGGGGDDDITATTTDDVNFRTGPGRSYDVIFVVPPGTEVILTGNEENGFMSVEIDGQNGWISGAYLMVPDGGGSGGGGNDETMTVTEDLNLRSGPSTADSIVAVMPAGATVTVTGAERNGFLPVTYRGTAGWAYAQYLS